MVDKPPEPGEVFADAFERGLCVGEDGRGLCEGADEPVQKKKLKGTGCLLNAALLNAALLNAALLNAALLNAALLNAALLNAPLCSPSRGKTQTQRVARWSEKGKVTANGILPP